MFIPAIKYIKYFSDTTQILSWKSNGMIKENIKNITKSDSSFATTYVDHNLLPDRDFHGNCLIKTKISIPKKVIDL